jgi:ribosomal protein S6--L-glutamate ligase
MRICLITPRPDHPLLAATTALLTLRHQVESIDPATWGDEPVREPADVYLLKARTPRALALARSLEEHGAPVLNSAASTGLCQDRMAMAWSARRAGLPFAATRVVALSEPAPSYPLVIKSRHSRKGDLVARVDNAAQWRALSADWPNEPVVAQEFAPNSGWDHKLWVIDGQVFAALRRSELADDGPPSTLPLALAELPEGWLALAREVGSVFALDVYGVDVIDTGDGGPLIVDVNAFPGIRGQAGAPEALAALTLRVAGRR